MLRMAGEIAEVEMLRVRSGRGASAVDCVAVEAPLEVRVGGTAFAILMRTPGARPRLAAGFLFAERVSAIPMTLAPSRTARTADAAPSRERRRCPDCIGASAAAARAALAGRRAVVASSACGVCGRQSIADLAAGCRAAAAAAGASIPRSIGRLPRALRDRASGVRSDRRHARGRAVSRRRVPSSTSRRTSVVTTRSTRSIGRLTAPRRAAGARRRALRQRTDIV